MKSLYAFQQVSLRVPEGYLLAVDRVVAHAKEGLENEGKTFAADRINRSSVLRQALEQGLIFLGKDLPCPRDEIFLPPGHKELTDGKTELPGRRELPGKEKRKIRDDLKVRSGSQTAKRVARRRKVR